MVGKQYGKEDRLRDTIYSMLKKSSEPLETMEIVASFNDETITRAKVLSRLLKMATERIVCGKQLKAGKGIWIWWVPRSAGINR